MRGSHGDEAGRRCEWMYRGGRGRGRMSVVQLRRKKVERMTPCEGGEGRDRREVVEKQRQTVRYLPRQSDGRQRDVPDGMNLLPPHVTMSGP